MKDFVREFIGKIPALDHAERVTVKAALEGVDDYQKVCDLIEIYKTRILTVLTAVKPG